MPTQIKFGASGWRASHRILQDKIAIGGEESSGVTIRHHVPKKDDILAGLLCCEMVASRGRSLEQE